MTARERAERQLTTAQKAAHLDGYSTGATARATLRASRRIGWALLDVADAIREHSATVDRIELRQHRRSREGRS